MHATFDFVSIRVCCMSWPHCSMHISTIARKRCRIVRRKRGREIGVWRLPQLMVILCHMFVCSGACLASERWFYSTLSEPHQNRLACTYFLDLITICCHIYQHHIQKNISTISAPLYWHVFENHHHSDRSSAPASLWRYSGCSSFVYIVLWPDLAAFGDKLSFT